MPWATPFIQKLLDGEIIQFRPTGNSMQGRIESKQLCTVEPITDSTTLDVGDVVLCKVRSSYYLHLINAIRKGQYQIANNKGRVNGWITKNAIYGKLTKVE